MSDPQRKRDLAAIHTGKKALGLDDDAYRDLLERISGMRSAADLDQWQRRAVLEELRRLGFARERARPARPSADRPQARLAAALWWDLWQLGAVDDRSERALDSFVRRQTRVGGLRMCGPAELNLVVEALKSWCGRLGFTVEQDADWQAALLAAQWARLKALDEIWGHAELTQWRRNRGYGTDDMLPRAIDLLGKWVRKAMTKARARAAAERQARTASE